MFEDIRPYNDAETAAALRRVSNNRLMDQISAFLFPGKDPDILRNTLNTIRGAHESFQALGGGIAQQSAPTPRKQQPVGQPVKQAAPPPQRQAPPRQQDAPQGKPDPLSSKIQRIERSEG